MMPLAQEDAHLNDYEQNKNCFARRILFLHALQTLQTVRSAIAHHQLHQKDVPTIKPEDNCRVHADNIYQHL